MAKAAKPWEVIVNEGGKHLTKAEIEARKKGEESMLSGVRLREYDEVKSDPEAHKLFKRTVLIMGKIGKADAVYEEMINRYAILRAEVLRMTEEKRRIAQRIETLDVSEGADKEISALYGASIGLDKAIDRKRGLIMMIEKEACLTVSSALRTIPKKPAAEEPDPMAELLARRNA